MLLEERLETTPYFPWGFPIHAQARQRYLGDAWQGQHANGNEQAQRVLLMRTLADRLNRGRDFSRPGVEPARAGELLALGLLTEIMRHIAHFYCAVEQPKVISEGIQRIQKQSSKEIADRAIAAFYALYPPEPVALGNVSAEEHLQETWQPLPAEEQLALELILLELQHENPALAPYLPLFDDTALREQAPYRDVSARLEQWLDTRPPLRATGQRLTEMLRAPIMACPHSIEAQLEFVRTFWTAALPARLLERLHVVRGVLREENAMRGLGPGPSEALTFGVPAAGTAAAAGGGAAAAEVGYPEYEAFTPDRAWMPNVVLIAKTVYVWLDQLSKKHARAINRLDEIPDEELDRLRDWGFNALWLIGIWERSSASRKIKRMTGNPEAEASAYSLYDYVIARDLGGEEAYRDLEARASRRGIRLASDMVPNHVGIYSRWVVEHPNWFVQLDHPPFPGYTFNGSNLSDDSRIGLYIEDGYWDRRDAAVVFKRVDFWTGDTRYIYHGNDGTSMPWNDTAQLNYLIPEVREAVLQTILHVARHFPIIRFDAAMTLAKRHFQRLWYPREGEGGAIPSRAEHGMSKEQFDAAFPKEFWREVVDRLAEEAPETLLLAEAFWLMEGYFVRTLGMHRVYNSAFMNMLKLEDNGKYRQTIKNVLEFSPEIIQRFVNFMNNPDEDTAEAQFGKGDKYFGVAMMLATMPGLPMFGHGQIEGLTEKYGMEYRRAYYDESPDQALMDRHAREIFPILRMRRLWSGAANFALFDLFTADGGVNENVFAYANRTGRERGLVIYNNCIARTEGTLHLSSAINEGTAEEPRLRQRPINEVLGLNTEATCYYIFRDTRSGLEFLRHAQQLADEGLHVALDGYAYHVFVDWREIHDFDYSWGQLNARLAGAGVRSVHEAYHELHLASIIEPFRRVMNGETLELLQNPAAEAEDLKAFETACLEFLEAVCHRMKLESDPESVLVQSRALRENMLHFEQLLPEADWHAEVTEVLNEIAHSATDDLRFWRIPAVYTVLRPLGELIVPDHRDPATFSVARTSAAWMREWFLMRQIARTFEDQDGDAWRANNDARLIRIALAHGEDLLNLQKQPWGPILFNLFEDVDTRGFLGVNHYNGRRWLNREQLERMLHMTLFLLAVERVQLPEAADELAFALDNIRIILRTAADTGYDLDWMLDSLK